MFEQTWLSKHVLDILKRDQLMHTHMPMHCMTHALAQMSYRHTPWEGVVGLKIVFVSLKFVLSFDMI